MLSAANEAAALERLHELKCTDGLPVVVPTEARVARMALASGLDRDLALGEMGPGKGIATVEKVAVAAVMAGCVADYMPLVIAAVKAVLDPRFDLTEMQATTHCTAPLILVNGPARHEIGPIACGFGALGPGHRANASIGRALRLAMINIGGGRPGESDMALLGHPGKFTYCLGEDEEASPFPPLHVGLGFAAEDSTVTVIGAEAPHSVLFSGDGDDPDSANRLLECLAVGLANIVTNNAVLTGGAAMVLLNPEHAAVLADAGLDRPGIAERLHRPVRPLHRRTGALRCRLCLPASRVRRQQPQSLLRQPRRHPDRGGWRHRSLLHGHAHLVRRPAPQPGRQRPGGDGPVLRNSNRKPVKAIP